MKTVNAEYQEAHKEYKKRLKNRPHLWGETNCLVCSAKFKKTSGIHLYCSNECKKINALKTTLDIHNKKANTSTTTRVVNHSSWLKSALGEKHIAVIVGLAVYENWKYDYIKDKQNNQLNKPL